MERRTEITLLGDSILKGIQVDPKTRGYQVRNDIGIPELEAEFSLHLPAVPLPEFRERYRGMVRRLREAGIQPILMNLPPLLSQWFFDWWCRDLDQAAVRTWLGDVSNIYAHQERYSRTVESLAREEDVPLVDVRGAFLAHGHLETLLCEDGTHPNSTGQALIGQAFRKFAEAQESLPETA